ncbi:fumarylacetoacetate hydrolase family protein [Oscillibacter sp. GMB15532]|uniref:fumarylacetoacetate hydrolase family protein n=1 Tax=Oscillibacter sp. GMB15532 TaxID=3230022 RepID=UPI0034DFEFD4
MRLATIRYNDMEQAGIVTAGGVFPVAALNAAKGTAWATDLLDMIRARQVPGLTAWYNAGGKEELERLPGCVPAAEVVYGPLYRNPRRIFGIGLNYVDHAGDIGSAAPTGFPGSFFKQADTLVGPDDEILLPMLKEAQKTTAEAELGIIMGRDCRDVPEADWESAIVGYTTILDMTEESILKGNDFVQGNPRYLTIVKNFPTFFSFGPELVTPDEVPDVLKLEVQSVHNGKVHARNTVSNMTHQPARLVSLHSSIQGWYAGDVLSTGTPRAFELQDGDIAECRIYGPSNFEMRPLLNPVVDLKLHPKSNK